MWQMVSGHLPQFVIDTQRVKWLLQMWQY